VGLSVQGLQENGARAPSPRAPGRARRRCAAGRTAACASRCGLGCAARPARRRRPRACPRQRRSCCSHAVPRATHVHTALQAGRARCTVQSYGQPRPPQTVALIPSNSQRMHCRQPGGTCGPASQRGAPSRRRGAPPVPKSARGPGRRRRPGAGRPGQDASAAWVARVTWAVADAVLAAAPSAFERAAAARCWVGLEVPGVAGASGGARYGCGPPRCPACSGRRADKCNFIFRLASSLTMLPYVTIDICPSISMKKHLHLRNSCANRASRRRCTHAAERETRHGLLWSEPAACCSAPHRAARQARRQRARLRPRALPAPGRRARPSPQGTYSAGRAAPARAQASAPERAPPRARRPLHATRAAAAPSLAPPRARQAAAVRVRAARLRRGPLRQLPGRGRGGRGRRRRRGRGPWASPRVRGRGRRAGPPARAPALGRRAQARPHPARARPAGHEDGHAMRRVTLLAQIRCGRAAAAGCL